MRSGRLPARLTLAVAVAASQSIAPLAGDESAGTSAPRSSGNEPGNSAPRNNSRTGVFRGGRLRASSFGDGSAPGGNSVGGNSAGVSANPAADNAWMDSQPGGGFLGRYGSAMPGIGMNGGMPGGMGGMNGGMGGMGGLPPPGSDPTSTSYSRATIGIGSPANNGSEDQPDGPGTFPRRVGNTETRQWEIGANLPVDPSYAYWASWGTGVGLLAEFGWFYPFFMGMGWPGMGAAFTQPGWNGYGPSPGYGMPRTYGPNDSSAEPEGAVPTQGGSTIDSGTSLNSARAGGGMTTSQTAAPRPGRNGVADVAAHLRYNVEKGEARFRARDYRSAAYYWKHAVADDPQNGVLALMQAQALLATAQFSGAASATRAAMRLLPENQWGVVIENRCDLYGEPCDYLDQLFALDKAARAKPSDPALWFLAGFHYAYLGYPKAALDNLEKGLKLAPEDEPAQKLRDRMQALLSPAEPPPVPQPPP